MKILITGASSYVGTRLYFDLNNDFETIGTYFNHSQFIKLQHLDIISKEHVKTTKPELKTRFDLAHDILKAFDIQTIHEDKHDTSAVASEDLSILKKLLQR